MKDSIESKITVRGNGHWIELIGGYDLTSKELEEFDYLDDPINDFTGFKYKGNIYSLDEFTRYNEVINGVEYHGILNHTYFSGILIILDYTGEAVKVYNYYC